MGAHAPLSVTWTTTTRVGQDLLLASLQTLPDEQLVLGGTDGGSARHPSSVTPAGPTVYMWLRVRRLVQGWRIVAIRVDRRHPLWTALESRS
jgi:hypothetical protein